MGIRFTCPNGHKLHVKAFLAGKRGVCPQCGAKILIPSEDQPPPQVPLAVPPRVGPVEPPAGRPASLTDTASPSIVIAVTESPAPNPSNAVAPAAVSSPNVATSPPATLRATVLEPITTETVAATQPVIVADAIEPISPADRYVARRERKRRRQLVFAMMLLAAVIMLSAVLIFVLLRGAGSTPTKDAPPLSFHPFNSSRLVAASSDNGFNARSAMVARQ